MCQNSHDPRQSPGGKGSLMPLKEGPGPGATAAGDREKTLVSPKMHFAQQPEEQQAPLHHFSSSPASSSSLPPAEVAMPFFLSQQKSFFPTPPLHQSTATPGLKGLEKYHLPSVCSACLFSSFEFLSNTSQYDSGFICS